MFWTTNNPTLPNKVVLKTVLKLFAHGSIYIAAEFVCEYFGLQASRRIANLGYCLWMVRNLKNFMQISKKLFLVFLCKFFI